MNKPISPLSRRELLGAAAAVGAVGLGSLQLSAQAAPSHPALADAIARLQYLTPPDQFCKFVREKPRIDSLSPEKLRSIGLDRDTWQLEVIPDADSDCKIGQSLGKDRGTALSFAQLLKLAENHAVRYVKVMTCTNAPDPFGVGLWEGVPLREVVWLTRPSANVRRLYSFGYHNDDPKQRFQSSLPISRVLEDAPGDLPVILCYKCNGQWLSAKAGGPVRLIVPESYGNRCIKWLQRIVLTNSYQCNDTYATWNNDVESPLKTYARFINPPKQAKTNQAITLVGAAQVGMSGLSKVQYSVRRQGEALPPDDPYFTKLNWIDAAILPPPENWGGGLPDGKLPPVPLQFDPATGKPRSWPMRYALAHWSALVEDLPVGEYELRCRSIDGNGVAQPMPRPFAKAGANSIQVVRLTVEA